jgi:hypothetical protein
MNPLLLHALNRLADETRAFLHDVADPELERWEAYMARRAAIIAELEGIACSADELAEPAVVMLKNEIFQQEALVREKALTKLSGLGEKLRTLKVGRRALRGYGMPSAPILFERSL